ncbi:MAG: hypothetical protein IJX11_05480 [Bacteroidales bacterium]|nr:hypothetical protein [Bacteroidales bacterium]
MKYFVRAVKYFFYFVILMCLILAALVLIGAAEYNGIDSLFADGYNSLWKIAVFFAVIAAVYPKVGFIKRDAFVQGEWNDIRSGVASFMNERGYELESEGADAVTFRFRGIAGRLSRMYEDRVTITREPEKLCLEGLRKDVMRLAAGLENRFSPEQE